MNRLASDGAPIHAEKPVLTCRPAIAIVRAPPNRGFPLNMSTTTAMSGPDRRPAEPQQRQRWLAASSAPWLMIAATVLGVGGGLALDRWLDCTPWGVLGCSLAGIAAGIAMVIREGSR